MNNIISYPPIFINDYLAEKADERFGNSLQTIPFFPTMPSTIEQLTETFPDGGGVFCVYDRMFRMRRKAFPHIKDEQVLYYFYSTGLNSQANLIETTQVVQDLLDRADESAQEVNRWLQGKLDPETKLYKGKFLPVYFHEFTIYQLEEARDIVDFGTARTYAGNKIIISYCYHTMGHKLPGGGIDPNQYNGTTI